MQMQRLQLVELVVARHGVPQRVISDQGTHFTANLFHQMMKVLSTRNVFTTPYHAQSNGQCERMNGTLVQLLRIYCKWAEYLPYALFAYRSSIHESTGYTPFAPVFNLSTVSIRRTVFSLRSLRYQFPISIPITTFHQVIIYSIELETLSNQVNFFDNTFLQFMLVLIWNIIKMTLIIIVMMTLTLSNG